MTQGPRCLIACIGLALLGGCAAPMPLKPVGAAQVDRSYTVFDQSSDWGLTPGRLVAYVKPRPSGDRLAVCGVAMVDVADNRIARFWSLLSDQSSYVALGEGDKTVKIPTRFMPGHRRALIGKDLATVPPPVANCIETTIAWQDGFAAAPMKLHLDYTPPAPPPPIYIYTPPPRKK